MSRAVPIRTTKSACVPKFFIVLMRLFPFWKDMRPVARTLPHEVAVMGGSGGG